MKLLYPAQTVSEERVAAPPLAGGDTPAARFLELLHAISTLLGEAPAPLPLAGGGALSLLYRNAAYLFQDLTEATAGLAAAVSSACPLRFYGATEGRETAEWTVSPLELGTALVRLRSASGRAFDHLEGLGVEIELPGAGQAAALAELCAGAPFLSPCAVAAPRGAALLAGSPLLAPVRGSRFCYLCWEPQPAPRLLPALNAGHKLALWRDFLAYGLQPMEFDWLWELYHTGGPLLLLEWEMALHAALAELGFCVERGGSAFRVLDGAGRERRFDFARGGPAEKVFLKLLFPLDARQSRDFTQF